MEGKPGPESLDMPFTVAASEVSSSYAGSLDPGGVSASLSSFVRDSENAKNCTKMSSHCCVV